MRPSLFFIAAFAADAIAGPILPRTPEALHFIEVHEVQQVQPTDGGSGATFPFAELCEATDTSTTEPPSDFAKQMLAYHNVHRTNHGSCSLRWDTEAEAAAAKAARSCKFSHQGTGGGHFGQNIAESYGGGGGNQAAMAMQMWYVQEGQQTGYKGGDMGQGHFTQVVWKTTTAVGCAISDCGQMSLVFCNYKPAGNMMGDFEANVPGCKGDSRPICAEQQSGMSYSGGTGGGDDSSGSKCISDQELGLPSTLSSGGG